MITHFDMNSGEVIEPEDRDPVGPAPMAGRESQPVLRLVTVDEAVALGRRRRPGPPPDAAQVPVAIWLRSWR